jgi:ubiquitin-like modifier-activating enzyme ATG7
VHDRTLDQQCTVTRAGVSQCAAGVCVELLMSLVQHAHGHRAPALLRYQHTTTDDVVDDKQTSSCLGTVPHQIRAYLSRFEQVGGVVAGVVEVIV